jgi:hypothetical protein
VVDTQTLDACIIKPEPARAAEDPQQESILLTCFGRTQFTDKTLNMIKKKA